MICEKIKKIIANIRNYVNGDNYEKFELKFEVIKALDEAIKTIDIAEKYRWHDLRINPDDLPGDSDCAYTWYECVHENFEDEVRRPYYQFSDGEFGYWKDEFDPVSLGFIDSVFETIDDIGYERVIAWRYIDPFEEVEG